MIDKDDEENKADKLLFKILIELESLLAITDYIDQTQGITDSLSEEEKRAIDEKLRKRKENFNPENYYKNTENEDNFEKPNKNQIRAMYKGVNKPAVLWLIEKEGKDIAEIIGGEFEKIPYEDNIYVYANKNRDVDNLDPNFVLHGEELIRGKVLFIEENKGKLIGMDTHKMLDIKDDMRSTRVLYLDEDNDEREV